MCFCVSTHVSSSDSLHSLELTGVFIALRDHVYKYTYLGILAWEMYLLAWPGELLCLLAWLGELLCLLAWPGELLCLLAWPGGAAVPLGLAGGAAVRCAS